MYFTLNAGGREGDSDKDGVVDSKDRCPGTQRGMEVSENGCPMVVEEVKLLGKNIYFQTASNVIKSESYPSLEVADIIYKQQYTRYIKCRRTYRQSRRCNDEFGII